MYRCQPVGQALLGLLGSFVEIMHMRIYRRGISSINRLSLLLLPPQASP